MGWTPLFLNAEPHRTAVTVASVVECRIARRMPAFSSASVSSSPSRYFSMIASSWSASDSSSRVRHSAARSAYSAGMSTTSNLSPLLVLSSMAHSRPFMRTRSMTPRNWSSPPQGSCRTSGTALSRLMIMSTVR